MTILRHTLTFLLAFGIIWIISGLIIGAVDRIARRYNRSAFAVAFFTLGILTSISEISVAFNSVIEGVPQISAGNLAGASVVIFFLIIPLLALGARSIDLNHSIRWSMLVLTLCVIAAPSLVALDGIVLPTEGILLILLYCMLIMRIRSKQATSRVADHPMTDIRSELIAGKHATLRDALAIFGGAVLIFFAGNMLVDESVYFSGLLNVPASLAGLLILSIGTNTPELILAFRSILSKHTEIAFGDYLGSAAANTLIFGFLPIANGAFTLNTSEFAASFFVLTFGLSLFALFARTKNTLSRRESVVLLALYTCFLVAQIGTIFR